MKRTLILYASTHHGNTRRLAEAMAEAAGAELCDLLHDPLPDLSGYDLIGMASGIYYGKLHPPDSGTAPAAGTPSRTEGVPGLYLRHPVPCL